MGDEAGCGGRVWVSDADVLVEGVDEEVKVEGSDVGVGDEDVRRGGEGCDEGGCDVVVEVESTVNRVPAKDGDLTQTHCRLVTSIKERGYLYQDTNSIYLFIYL